MLKRAALLANQENRDGGPEPLRRCGNASFAGACRRAQRIFKWASFSRWDNCLQRWESRAEEAQNRPGTAWPPLPRRRALFAWTKAVSAFRGKGRCLRRESIRTHEGGILPVILFESALLRPFRRPGPSRCDAPPAQEPAAVNEWRWGTDA